MIRKRCEDIETQERRVDKKGYSNANEEHRQK